MKRLILCFSFFICQITLILAQTAPAFPGAEGHGRYTTGGRGGVVRHVTNLNDSGTGSLRAAVSGSTKKTVVFDVSGIIALNSDLIIGDNTTIAGQTAPSPGITLRYRTIRPGNNNIIRFIRFRRGEERDVNDGADATWQKEKKNIIFDHCSFSWSIDEIASFYDNRDFTMQWCTLGEALANPGHTKGEHSYGGIWGGKGASFHHNFLCHMQNRVPRFCGARYNWTGYDTSKFSNAIQAEIVDFRNCVMYNWGNGNGCYGGTGGGNINIVNNYYKAGPATYNKTRVTQVSVATSDNASGSPFMGYCCRYYIKGNYVTAASTPANYDWSGVIYDSGTFTINGERYCADADHKYGDDVTYVKNSNNVDCVKIKLDQPTEKGEVTTHTAQHAYEKVLAYGGASLYRDAVDARYMQEAANGTTTYIGTAEKTGDGKTINHRPGIIDFVSDQGTYTLTENARATGFDSDSDGIPDAWETANGLNPNNASDGQLYTLDTKNLYTNLEVYANSLVQEIMIGGNANATESVNDYYPAYTKEDGTKVKAENDGSGGDDTPVTSIDGDITWSLSEGTATPAYTFSSAISNYVEGLSMEVGSHLKTNGKKSTSNSSIAETLFTITDQTQDNEATTENAVRFTISPKQGHSFQPTHISFNATRWGTDHGKFKAYWLYDDDTAIDVAGEQLAARDNANPNYTTIDTDIEGLTATKASALVIHLYDIPYNTNTKNMGLANVVISGKIFSESSDIQSITKSTVFSDYYNLQGMRIKRPQHGTFICRQHMANGTIITRKITVR